MRPVTCNFYCLNLYAVVKSVWLLVPWHLIYVIIYADRDLLEKASGRDGDLFYQLEHSSYLIMGYFSRSK